MCYHYSLTKRPSALPAEPQWEMPFAPVYHASGFSFPVMPVVTQQAPDRVQAYRWGLIPHWTKSAEEAGKLRAQTLNARGETIFEKPSFRSYAPGRRCIVPADGFFEWMDRGGKKYPHYIRLKEGEPFAFGGLYSHWTDAESGEVWRTYTIITTEANPLMARIHNTKRRMPLLLPERRWAEWLDPSLERAGVEELLQPPSDGEMEAWPITRLITARGQDTNVPGITEPAHYPELAGGE